MQNISQRFSFDYDLSALRGDVFGGLTAVVVGLPAALAFGVASGLGAVAGIYGAIAVGFFAAVFGGTKSQISGPTGPMAAIVTLAGPENLGDAFTIVILAGIIQILLGVLKIGRFVAYTPYSVISGFMSGIGVIIIILQILPFIGQAGVSGGPMGALQAWPEGFANFGTGAFIIAGVTLAVGIFWPQRLSRYLPSTLAALLTGTFLAVAGTQLTIPFLAGAPVIGGDPSGLPSVVVPHLSTDLLVNAVQPALIIALLGSIDNLLTSLIADSMTRTRHNLN